MDEHVNEHWVHWTDYNGLYIEWLWIHRTVTGELISPSPAVMVI